MGKYLFHRLGSWKESRKKVFYLDQNTEVFAVETKIESRLCSIRERKIQYFSINDLKISDLEMYKLYYKRFQIECMFRDTKQHLGLEECQSRKKESLAFHFNFSFLTYNLCRVEHLLSGKKVFSLQTIKKKIVLKGFSSKRFYKT